MSVWFTSDLHFRHARLVEIRGFETEIDAHDESILDALVAAVGSGDQLWILGDITVGGKAAEDWRCAHSTSSRGGGTSNCI